MKKRAYVFGRGQDAHTMVELLHQKGVDATQVLLNINDHNAVENVIYVSKPDFVINFGAISSLDTCEENPLKCFQTNCFAVQNMLCSIRDYSPKTKFFNAGSVQDAGDSLYGQSKRHAKESTKWFREHFGLWAMTGILSNHTSKIQKQRFVIPKICKTLAAIKDSLNDFSKVEPLYVGNLDSKITVIHAEDICEGIWLALNQKTPRDWTFSSSAHYSIRQIIEKSLEVLDIKYLKGWNESTDYEYCLFHKALVPLVIKDPKLFSNRREFYQDMEIWKTKNELGWTPSKSFDEILTEITSYYLISAALRTET